MDMWSLWPLMMEALADWAIDFFPSMYLFCLLISFKLCFFGLFDYFMVEHTIELALLLEDHKLYQNGTCKSLVLLELHYFNL